MTLVAMNNEAALDPWDGITFFILVQNRSFRTSELCSRCSTLYQEPSVIEVIREGGVFPTKRYIEIPHQTFYSLTIKELEGVERILCEYNERRHYLSGHMKLEQSKLEMSS